MKIPPKGWRLASLGGSPVALEWSDPAAGLWVQRLLGCHPRAAAGLPIEVYRLHTDRIDQSLTVFASTECIYRGPDPAAGAHAIMEAMMRVWTRNCHDGLMLHAGLMSKHGRGLMIGGVSGAGKSSLAAWLLSQGWSYHGDEQTYADAGDLHWQGFARPLCFKGDWLSMFPMAAAEPESVVQVGGQALVPASLFGQKLPPEEAVRPGIVLFPKFRKGSEFSLKRLPAGRAAIQLAPLILNGGNLSHRGVAQAAGIARDCPAYDLTYGHFGQLAPLLQLQDVLSQEERP